MTGPTVRVKQGTILGTTGTNLNGEEFYKFLGVPFAKPPVGSLKFKAPQPPDSWQGVRECTKNGNTALSFNMFAKQIEGSEDCLYLNVHTRSLPKVGTEPKPVMVFIHGGAFTMGNGTEQMCDPQYLLTQDIVLVSMNYRLGIFGFLSLEDPSLEVPGNAGLKDQTMALKWVQENISSFNGDPNNVTIFGVSAGGASVEFQVLSPSAKGLFHKAIAQSGSTLNPWAWGKRNVIPLAEKLGHKVSNEREALDVLMNTPSEQLYTTSLSIPDVLASPDLRRPFGPIIEKPNPTAFLTEDPYVLLSEGRYNHVPYIQGICSREGLIVEMFNAINLSNQEEYKIVLPWNLQQSTNHAKLAEKLRNLYHKNGNVTKDAIFDYMGDILFAFGILESTKLMLKNAKNPNYFYIFDYNTNKTNSLKSALKIDKNATGTSHGVDQSYLFPVHLVPEIDEQLELIEEDIEAIKRTVQIWTDFARSGKPHKDWLPVVDPDNIQYLCIAEKLESFQNPFEERMKVWNEILKETGGFNAFSLEKAF